MLHADWQPLALPVVDELLSDERMQEKEVDTLRHIVEETREQLSKRSLRERDALKKRLDSWAENPSIEPIRTVVQTAIEKLYFLEALYRFQVEAYEADDKTNARFALQPPSTFIRDRYDRKRVSAPRLRDDFGYSYRELAAAMNFPVISNPDNKVELRTKLAEDLWRIYNTKNKLPPENRKYQPDTELPRLHESFYGQYYFDKAYDGFIPALKEVLQKSTLEAVTPEQEKEALELSDGEVDRWLLRSMAPNPYGRRNGAR